jgi:hypothetical protein
MIARAPDSRLLLAWAAAVGAAAGAAGCTNPVVDARVDALGDEVSGVDPSEYHRPGQPCLLCHGVYGGADPEMSVGGTIFATLPQGDTKPYPAPSVEVTVFDSLGSYKKATTNCMGNFYIAKKDWDPGYPIGAEILCQNGRRKQMLGRISRNGSCGYCHQYNEYSDPPNYGAPNQGSPGVITCDDATVEAPTKQTCPGGVP